jgi:hypothetical protein
MKISLSAFSMLNLLRSFVMKKFIAEKALSDATELATVSKILTASCASCYGPGVT